MANTNAPVIGDTGFVGRHTIAELLDHDYDVTALSRGSHGFHFPDGMDVNHVIGDRTDDDTVADVAQQTEPDVVIDCAAYHPADIRTATDIFTDVAAYVYVSSGGGVQQSGDPQTRDRDTATLLYARAGRRRFDENVWATES